GVRFFKPLPRLDENNSEESVHTIQVTSDFINLSNTPSSWTDSRKSSEFGYLSSVTYSPPENILESKVIDSQQDHIVPAAAAVETPSQCQQQSSSSPRPPSSSKEKVHADGDPGDDDDGDNDTVRQLRANIPYTPVEPSEAEIAPCLGSRLSMVSLDKLENLISASGQGRKNTFIKRTMEYSATTVLDSSSIWEKSSNGIQETIKTVDSRMVNSTDRHEEGVSVGNRNNTVTINGEKETDTSHHNLRPSSPAEGAVSEFSHQYHHHQRQHHHQYYQNASSISSFSSSLPCVFTKDFQSSDEVYEMKNDTIATPHYASDSNLKLCSQT
ncbi:unnamed protein product, partial [Trichobilharzia regenti]